MNNDARKMYSELPEKQQKHAKALLICTEMESESVPGVPVKTLKNIKECSENLMKLEQAEREILNSLQKIRAEFSDTTHKLQGIAMVVSDLIPEEGIDDLFEIALQRFEVKQAQSIKLQKESIKVKELQEEARQNGATGVDDNDSIEPEDDSAEPDNVISIENSTVGGDVVMAGSAGKTGIDQEKLEREIKNEKN